MDAGQLIVLQCLLKAAYALGSQPHLAAGAGLQQPFQLQANQILLGPGGAAWPVAPLLPLRRSSAQQLPVQPRLGHHARRCSCE